jgi:formate dehydrogenase major subunit/NADH-quinone oxidoreductase subunit G
MKEISLTIDGERIRAIEGEKILWAALENGIYIPNLCAIQDRKEPLGACRLCFVEVEGRDEPAAACAEPVREGMVVWTRGETALRLARTSAELLLASHPADCGHCQKNRSCELQKIARHLGMRLKTKRFRRLDKNLPIDDSSPVFICNPNKCVLCGRCVWVCRERLKIGAIGFTHRGSKRVVSTFKDSPLAGSRCEQCGECVKVCPVGALAYKA